MLARYLAENCPIVTVDDTEKMKDTIVSMQDKFTQNHMKIIERLDYYKIKSFRPAKVVAGKDFAVVGGVLKDSSGRFLQSFGLLLCHGSIWHSPITLNGEAVRRSSNSAIDALYRELISGMRLISHCRSGSDARELMKKMSAGSTKWRANPFK